MIQKVSSVSAKKSKIPIPWFKQALHWDPSSVGLNSPYISQIAPPLGVHPELGVYAPLLGVRPEWGTTDSDCSKELSAVAS